MPGPVQSILYGQGRFGQLPAARVDRTVDPAVAVVLAFDPKKMFGFARAQQSRLGPPCDAKLGPDFGRILIIDANRVVVAG